MRDATVDQNINPYNHPEAFTIRSPSIRLASNGELDSLCEEAVEEGLEVHTMLSQSKFPHLLDLFYNAPEVPEYAPLFGETAYAALLRKSPWFFGLDLGKHFWPSLRKECLSWGFLAIGTPEIQQGLAHWRSLLNALLPDNALTHFRFYSSNVLLRTINACTTSEIQWLVGPYAYLVVPYPPDSETPWAVVSNPALAGASEKEVAEKYTFQKGTWWQVTDEHLAAFEHSLDTVYKRNLIVWLWENRFEETQQLNQKENLHRVVDDLLTQAKCWGFTAREHQTRCIAALLPFMVVSEPLGEEGEVLRHAVRDPETSLQRLEALADRRRKA